MISDLKRIREAISSQDNERTTIVQRYIERPLLFQGRKLDVRVFAMLASDSGVLRGYMYSECYFRTASRQFDLQNFSRFVHLTNDAVQQHSEHYGKFETGNKLSINDF